MPNGSHNWVIKKSKEMKVVLGEKQLDNVKGVSIYPRCLENSLDYVLWDEKMRVRRCGGRGSKSHVGMNKKGVLVRRKKPADSGNSNRSDRISCGLLSP